MTVTRSAHPARSAALARCLGEVFAGSSAAVGTLYDLVGADLFAFATWQCGCRESAADVVQEVFVRLAQSVGRSPRQIKHPEAYLLTIVRRVAADRMQRERREPSLPLQDQLFDPIAPTPEARLDAERAGRALRALPPRQREAVALRYLMGRSWSEVGEITGVSLFTAASRGRLGLARLRRIFGVEVKT